MNVTYYEIYHNTKNSDYIVSKRLEMVNYANDFGIKPASRYFKTSKNTIKRWCKRYALYGIKGLRNNSSRPHHLRTTVSKKDVNKITNTVKVAKEKNKHITVNNVRKKTGIKKYSDVTINRYINRALEKKERNKKHFRANGGSVAFKKKLKPFELIQVDIKYLTDIDNLKPFFDGRNLAKYEVTARDVATGFSIVSFCSEKSLYYTYTFLKKVLYPFLKSVPNLDLKTVKIQTDNGTEFTNKRILTSGSSPKTSAFTNFCNLYFKKHRTNIPGHCTADSEVESFHWSIERDCLGWEDITNNETLLKYVNKYMNEYNRSVIKTRGYSPVEKIKKFYENYSLNVPKAVIL